LVADRITFKGKNLQTVTDIQAGVAPVEQQQQEQQQLAQQQERLPITPSELVSRAKSDTQIDALKSFPCCHGEQSFLWSLLSF
jgi:hypothetical protein